jgi:hypothetical protein
MKKSLAKKISMALLAGGMTMGLSGCIGSNAVTGYVMKFNLEAVDNRYARGGLNILLAPVYGLSIMADALVFNSIQFWAGKNPLDGKPHIFDKKVKTMMNINDSLDPSLRNAPVEMSHVEKELFSTQMVAVNETTFDINIAYTNGDTAVLRGEKNGDEITYSLNGIVIVETTMAKLKMFKA